MVNRSFFTLAVADRLNIGCARIKQGKAIFVGFSLTKRIQVGKKKLFAGFGSVRIGLENAALGLQPRVAFSRRRSQFFTIRTSQPANNNSIIFFSRES